MDIYRYGFDIHVSYKKPVFETSFSKLEEFRPGDPHVMLIFVYRILKVKPQY